MPSAVSAREEYFLLVYGIKSVSPEVQWDFPEAEARSAGPLAAADAWDKLKASGWYVYCKINSGMQDQLTQCRHNKNQKRQFRGLEACVDEVGTPNI